MSFFKETIVLTVITIQSLLLTSCYKKEYVTSLKGNRTLLQQQDSLIAVRQSLRNDNSKLQAADVGLIRLNSLLILQRQKTELENKQLKELEDEELALVNNAIIKYFNTITGIIYAYPAPCKNAANGHFRNIMTNKNLMSLANPKLNLRTKKAKNILAAFEAFSLDNQTAFILYPNYEPRDAEVVWSHRGDIATLISDLYQIVSSDDKNGSYRSAAGDIAKYYEKNRGTCHIGRHANGHISQVVHRAANAGIDSLNNLNDSSTSRAGRIEAVLKYCLIMLRDKLRTEGHDPWLNASWEDSYYFFLKGAALDLNTLN
ncbi:MAG: hypothetical protein JWQ66_1286 [Mucilaginibacter sp.]|nr:hypothetical protein [Mucilaginibacter sp.]